MTYTCAKIAPIEAQNMPRQKKPKVPKPRFPTPPAGRDHGDRRKEESRTRCRRPPKNEENRIKPDENGAQ